MRILVVTLSVMLMAGNALASAPTATAIVTRAGLRMDLDGDAGQKAFAEDILSVR